MSQRSFAEGQKALKVGATVAGRYLLRREIGEGGMGCVYEAEHTALGRRFALKVLRQEAWSEQLLRRFEREARALGKVSSARVAQVTDFGVDGEAGPFYVMELVDGETLDALLVRQPALPLDEALPIAVDLCEALADVHAAGIVHRDLKPSNVGLPRGGPVRVKLIDFGLATLVDTSAAERITRSQQLVGTMQYMSPEQFEDGPLAPTMDQYALGVLLYEMLTGRLPFRAETPAVLMQQHLLQPPPPFAEAAPGAALPAWLEELVLRLLAKKPEQRFSSMGEVATLLRGEGEMERAPTRRRMAVAGVLASPRSAARTAVVGMPRPGTATWVKVAFAIAFVLGVAVLGFLVMMSGFLIGGGGPKGKLESRQIEPARSPGPVVTPVVPPVVSAPPPTLVAQPAARPVEPPSAARPAKARPATTEKTDKPRPPGRETKGTWQGELIEEP